MARTVAELSKRVRITDYISLGVISAMFPLGKVRLKMTIQENLCL